MKNLKSNPVNVIMSMATLVAVPVWLTMPHPPLWITALAIIWLGSAAAVVLGWAILTLLYVTKAKAITDRIEEKVIKRLKKELGD